jgi:hypothetical protein
LLYPKASDAGPRKQRRGAIQGLYYALNVLQDAIDHSGDSTSWWVVEEIISTLQHTGIAQFKVKIPTGAEIRMAHEANPGQNSAA